MIINKLVTKLTILSATTGLSVFMYANVAEKVFLTDLPYVNSVAHTTLPASIEQLNSNIILNDADKYGFYGRPVTLRVPRINFALNLNESKQENNKWIVENGVASIQIYVKSQGGHLGNALIFGLPGDKLMNFVELLVENDKIVIETSNHWKYYYKVTKRTIFNIGDKYIISDSPASKITIVEENKGKIILIEAQFTNMEDTSI